MTNPTKIDGEETAGPAFSRRDFMRAAAAVGAASGLAATTAATARAQAPAPDGVSGELVVKGGHVLSMDDAVGDFAVGDVHVRDGKIVAVGESIDVAGATVIDASDRIVMPGFVDAHSHLWNAFLRGSVRGDDRVRGYFPTTNRAAPLCTPEDAFVSARFGAMEELLSGVTCIHNFSHNTRTRRMPTPRSKRCWRWASATASPTAPPVAASDSTWPASSRP